MSKVLTEVFNLWLAAETKHEQTRCNEEMVSLPDLHMPVCFHKTFFVPFFPIF